MSNFNPLYDDGYFKCLLDIREFINNSEKVGIRGVKVDKQLHFICSLIPTVMVGLFNPFIGVSFALGL